MVEFKKVQMAVQFVQCDDVQFRICRLASLDIYWQKMWTIGVFQDDVTFKNCVVSTYGNNGLGKVTKAP